MTRQEKIQQLKESLKNRHLSFYFDDNGKLKRYNMNSNREWIVSHIGKSWEVSDSLYLINGFDFVSMGIVEVNTSKIIWDEINGFYENCSAWYKQQINICEDTLKLISDSWLEVQNKHKLPRKINQQSYKIYKHSEKHKNSKYYSFELRGIHYPDRFYLFDDEIDGVKYSVLIPSKYIADNASTINTQRCFGLINKKYIQDYIESHQNTL